MLFFCESCPPVLQDGLDPAAATLNAIKGRPMAIDLLSILQDEKRSFSFLTQSVGLMADLDLGTEHLRWLGSSRFVYGYLRGSKYCPSAFVPLPNVFASPNSKGVPIRNLCQDWGVGKGGHGRGLARVHEFSTPFRRLASGGRNHDGTSASALCRRTRGMDHLRGSHSVHVCRKGPVRELVMHTPTGFPIHA